MFASKIKKTVEFEDGRIVIKKLSAHALDRARDAKQREFAKTANAFGPELLKSLRNATPEETAEAEKRRAANEGVAGADGRYTAFDRYLVLLAGIDSWTYDEALSERAIDDMDEEHVDRTFREIIDLSVPPVDPKVTEERTAKG